MRRIQIEMAFLATGIIGASSTIFSDRVFNAGIALPLSFLLLIVAFIIGLTHMPLTERKPLWRKIAIGSELIAAGTAALYLFGVITF
jgi:hypothetical protein